MTTHENTPEVVESCGVCYGCHQGKECHDSLRRSYSLDNAVRDICSVSVAPASKSEVKRIIETLLTSQKQKQIEEIVGIAKVLRDENKKTEKWSDDYYHALDDLITKIQANQ